MPLLTTADGSLYWMTQPAGGVLRSTDGGATWNQVARDGTLSELSPFLVELPGGSIGAVGNQVVLGSADKGATWQRIGPATPYPPMGLAYAPLRHAFYIWTFDCDHQQPVDPVRPENIMRLDVKLG
jgi:hypothetical protein